jgi:hypothetical protein
LNPQAVNMKFYFRVTPAPHHLSGTVQAAIHMPLNPPPLPLNPQAVNMKFYFRVTPAPHHLSGTVQAAIHKAVDIAQHAPHEGAPSMFTKVD